MSPEKYNKFQNWKEAAALRIDAGLYTGGARWLLKPLLAHKSRKGSQRS